MQEIANDEEIKTDIPSLISWEDKTVWYKMTI